MRCKVYAWDYITMYTCLSVWIIFIRPILKWKKSMNELLFVFEQICRVSFHTSMVLQSQSYPMLVNSFSCKIQHFYFYILVFCKNCQNDIKQPMPQYTGWILGQLKKNCQLVTPSWQIFKKKSIPRLWLGIIFS